MAAVYGRVDGLLAAAGTCKACGNCCRFTPGGIVLFASAVEVAYLLEVAGTPDSHGEIPRLAALARNDSACPASEDAAAWRCPYQRENLCAARGGRMLGCRTYFCEPPAREAGERVYEEALHEIRGIAGQGAWWYGPVRLEFEVSGLKFQV
jgi:hypothetical protein